MNKKLIVTLLFCMTLLGVSATDIYISALPQMMHDFNTTRAIVNSTILTFNLGLAISVLFVGVLSNRFGRKLIIISGIAIFALSAFLISCSSNIWLVLVLRFMQGYGAGGIIIVQRLILKDIMTEKEQIEAGGFLVFGSIISPALAPVIGAYLTKLWNWDACFMFSAIFALLLVILTAYLIPETNITPIKKLPRMTVHLREYLGILFNSACLNLIIILCLTFAAYFAFLGISSYLYIINLGLTPITYSYVFLLLAGSYLVGNGYMIYLNKQHYINSYQLIKRGVGISIVGLIILGTSVLTQNNWIILLCLTIGVMITRIAAALIINPIQIKIMNYFPDKGGYALGLAICLQFGTSGLAASMVGMLPQQQLLTGFVSLTALCILISLGSFITYSKLFRQSVELVGNNK